MHGYHPHDGHDDFGGLGRDLPRLVSRRRALAWLGGVGAAGVLTACSGSSTTTSTGTSAGETTTAASTPPTTDGTATSAATAGSTEVTAASTSSDATATAEAAASPGAAIPEETAGPYPADGSNGPNVFDEAGIVRTDITTSIGSMSGTADGAPATIRLTVVDAASGSPLPGAAVYLWHCTADGRYSVYEVEDQNYLRGVASADAGGVVTFSTIFPGCYRGRWPHAHFEVYADAEAAIAGNEAIVTSQLALPQAACEAAYVDDRYGTSAANLAGLSLTTDGVFRDGWEDQLAAVSGSDESGYAIDLLVRV